MTPKEELNHEQREALNHAMHRLHELIDEIEKIHGTDPRALDMLEIGGSLLEQQVEMNISYPAADFEIEIGPPGNREDLPDGLAGQLNNVQDILDSGFQKELFDKGGFLFLTPNGEESPSKEIDKFFNLEEDKDEEE